MQTAIVVTAVAAFAFGAARSAVAQAKYIVGIPVVAGMENTQLAPLFQELVKVTGVMIQQCPLYGFLHDGLVRMLAMNINQVFAYDP